MLKDCRIGGLSVKHNHTNGQNSSVNIRRKCKKWTKEREMRTKGKEELLAYLDTGMC